MLSHVEWVKRQLTSLSPTITITVIKQINPIPHPPKKTQTKKKKKKKPLSMSIEKHLKVTVAKMLRMSTNEKLTNSLYFTLQKAPGMGYY